MDKQKKAEAIQRDLVAVCRKHVIKLKAYGIGESQSILIFDQSGMTVWDVDQIDAAGFLNAAIGYEYGN